MPACAIVTADALNAASLLDSFIQACEGDGAVASFVGLARSHAATGEDVSALRLDRHPRLTQVSLEVIASAGADRFGVSGVLVVHRWGQMAPGDAIVFVAASARHRRDALNAVDYIMDRLKNEAIFWKKEEGIDGARWVEPTDEDRVSLARWD